MAIVVTPHSASHSAMAVRSQELAPKRRTFGGGPAVSRTALETRSAGTQTMCMSEWTSMPAALGLTSGIVGCAGGGRRGDFGRPLALGELSGAGGPLCRLMG